MNWNSNLVLAASNEEELKKALEQILTLYSNESKLLFDSYNKINSIHYGKNIRHRVYKIEFNRTGLENFIKSLDYSVDNKKAIISKIDESFNELEQLSNLILEAHELNSDTGIDIEKQVLNISSQIKNIQIELNDLLKNRQELNNELFLSFESKMGKIASDLNNSVSKSLQEISGFKNEIELGKNYREMIEMQCLNSLKNVKVYFVAFILSLILFTGILITPSLLREWADFNAQIGWRISIGLPLLWLVSFIFTHYKYYKVAHIKYQHILNLLGGGAYYIGELLEDKSAKDKANSRIIEMLLDYKDLSHLFYKEKAPIDKYLKRAIEIIKESKDIIADNTMHNKINK